MKSVKKVDHRCSGESCEICQRAEARTTSRGPVAMPLSNAPTKQLVEEIRKKVSDLVSEQPDKAVIILTEWLNPAQKSDTHPIPKATPKKVA